jgi:hypothetical protein
LATLSTIMAAFYAIMTTVLALLPTRLIVVTVAILGRLDVRSQLNLCRYEGAADTV